MSKYVVIEVERAEDHPKREQNLCLFFSKITKCLKNQTLMFLQETRFPLRQVVRTLIQYSFLLQWIIVGTHQHRKLVPIFISLPLY
jgi:hypothetical protein